MLLHAPQHGGLSSKAIRYPGFVDRAAPERRQLRYGEAVHLRLSEGDLLNIVNDEGAATAWLVPFDDRGIQDTRSLGLQAGLLSPVTMSGWDRRAFDGWLSVHDTTLTAPVGYPVFDGETAPGDIFTLSIQGTVDLWITLPIQPSEMTAGGAGGGMTIEISRPNRKDEWLPDPLGDIRDEWRVDRATAQAYRVAKGDYVQIIDVDGRQCSDFMAMRADALDDGVERYVDSAVTRTVVGGAYPGPGLFDKFFDQDMRPLLAVVQDTVGRHDTFALACTARGYEERGFPGHLNCSDNISDAYEPYGIGRRPAWPAINFFFNSWIMPTDNRLRSDEAWSRPGDYVVMQALTDLVCVSTACPDDVDPINGWNPTDIHVRVYKPERPIRRAIAYRAAPEAEAVLTEESAFHPRTSALTRSFTAARDVWVPSSFEGTRAIDEYWACRDAVTLQDMSSLRKLDILGPDAERLLDLALTRNVKKLSVNRGLYALMCDRAGHVLDDGTLFRLAPEVFRWCCGSDESGKQLKDIAAEHGFKVWIKSLSSAMPNLALQGPKSRDLLRDILFTQPTQVGLDNLKWFGCTIARLHDREGPPFLLTRSGFTGELGYEIFCDRSHALAIWDGLVEAGKPFALKPMGNEALDMLRIESGLMVAGAEFGPDVDAFESGLGFAVDTTKTEFVGRDALIRNGEAPRRKLVGLMLDGEEVASHGDPLFIDRHQVGVITSATRSPSLGRSIAIARIDVEASEPDQTIEVGRLDGHMKRLPAKVTSIPFVDPTRERPRS